MDPRQELEMLRRLAELEAKAGRPVQTEQPQAKPEPSFLRQAAGVAGNLAAGALRGAGSIGATLLAPQDMLQALLALVACLARLWKSQAGLRCWPRRCAVAAWLQAPTWQRVWLAVRQVVAPLLRWLTLKRLLLERLSAVGCRWRCVQRVAL